METVIELEKVSISQHRSLVLTNVTFKIAKGEFVYLIGKTGTGKSSLLKTMYGELPLLQGDITIENYHLAKLKPKEIPFLRRKMGIVFQDFQLLMDRTVSDNLAFVLRATGWKDKKLIDQRIKEVLSQVGLETKDFKMPYLLSGGEQQRLVIARALLNNPGIIIADEPTGNLDPDTSLEILKLLQKISKQGTAVLMATHDFYMIDKFPARLLKIDQGTVMDLGNSLFG